MTYILLINDSGVSCQTNQLLLAQDQAKHIESIEYLLDEIKQLKDNEQNYISSTEAKGFQEGYKEGLNTSLNEANILFAEYLESITKRVIEAHTLSQQSILQLALNVVRKIAMDIGSEDMITGIAKRAIKNEKFDQSLEIRVNASLAKSVKQKLQEQKTTNNNGTVVHIEVVPDHNMGEFDCIISSDSGITEASFEQQLRSLEQQLNRVTQVPNQDQ